MERFKNILQLTTGCEITQIENGEYHTWKYLMIHPEFKDEILAISKWSHNIDRLGISSMKRENFFVGEYDTEFVVREKLRQKEEMLELIKRDIKALHNELKFYGLEE